MPHPEVMSRKAAGIRLGRKADTASYLDISAEPTVGAVHDLGNLLQVASSALNLLARDPTVSAAPALEPLIVGARTALQRADTLVRDTIIRARKSSRETEHADINACLEVIEKLTGWAGDANIRLEVASATDLPMVRCDPLGLQNAVLNLVFNARDAMPNGGVISISVAEVVVGPAHQIEARVKDNGVGMSPETVVRAFEPFFTTKGNGLGGVGLPMVKRFVEEHGGTIEVESSFGSGTTVILRLPAEDLCCPEKSAR
ncbi:sensor histidine kinase [Mesorhizobium japonicum]|nr:ATP-binding protein [Mesorhizobium japonicum]